MIEDGKVVVVVFFIILVRGLVLEINRGSFYFFGWGKFFFF